MLGNVIDHAAVNGGLMADMLLKTPFRTELQFDNCPRAKSMVDTLIELRSIKAMDITKIPAALCQLFAVQASQNTLDHTFKGPTGEGMLDREFIRDALSNEFRLLGRGSHAAAYAIDDNWIIKINCSDDLYLNSDAGFDWLKACTELQENQFVPQMAALYQIDFMYVAVVERLTENNLTYMAPDGGCFLDLCEAHGDLEFDIGQYMTGMIEYPTFMLMGLLGKDELIELSEAYSAVDLSTGSVDDMVDFNLMLRGNVPVINDPFLNSTSESLVLGQRYEWVNND